MSNVHPVGSNLAAPYATPSYPAPLYTGAPHSTAPYSTTPSPAHTPSFEESERRNDNQVVSTAEFDVNNTEVDMDTDSDNSPNQQYRSPSGSDMDISDSDLPTSKTSLSRNNSQGKGLAPSVEESKSSGVTEEHQEKKEMTFLELARASLKRKKQSKSHSASSNTSTKAVDEHRVGAEYNSLYVSSKYTTKRVKQEPSPVSSVVSDAAPLSNAIPSPVYNYSDHSEVSPSSQYHHPHATRVVTPLATSNSMSEGGFRHSYHAHPALSRSSSGYSARDITPSGYITANNTTVSAVGFDPHIPRPGLILELDPSSSEDESESLIDGEELKSHAVGEEAEKEAEEAEAKRRLLQKRATLTTTLKKHLLELQEKERKMTMKKSQMDKLEVGLQ